MRFRASAETKVVKRKFKDQKDTGTTQDKDTAAAPPTLLQMKTKIIQRKFEDQEDTMRTPPQTPPPMQSPPPPCLTGEQQQQQAGLSLHRPPALPVVLPPALGAWALQASGRLGVVGRMLGPKADAEYI